MRKSRSVLWRGGGAWAALLALFVLAPGTAAAAIPQAERDALIDLYDSTGGPAWTDSAGWLGAPGTECSWSGVGCDGTESTVTDLALAYRGLAGPLPASLGNLTGVQALDLSGNQLTGGIPPELGNLASALRLRLHANRLDGPIPGELGGLASLTELYLSGNQLSGSIPPELGNLVSLQTLLLRTNRLSGSIPPQLGNLASLRTLSLGVNRLSGSIPPELGNLAHLRSLGLNQNNLVGSIPAALANLTEASSISLWWNGLHTSDAALRGFLVPRGFGEETQTVAVRELSAGGATETTVDLTWTTIPYTKDAGGYRVYTATTSGGPYTLFGTTDDKLTSSMTVTGLSPDRTYYFVIESVTDPHANNQNQVVSERSAEASATTLSGAAAGVALDFNGDGIADLLWHHQASGELYAWMLGPGAGDRADVTPEGAALPPNTAVMAGSYLTPKGMPDTKWQVRGLADWNADGKVDVLWHNQATGDLYVWFLDGTVAIGGSYLTPRSFSAALWQIRGVADFDADGKMDLLWHHQTSGDLYVWLMDGLSVKDGSYLTPKSFADTRWQIRALSDLDGDGKADLLWHHQTSGELYVWLLDGTVTTGGSFLTPRAFADTHWKIALAADFSGDGKPDLLWHNQATGHLYVWYLDAMAVTGGSYLTPDRFADTSWKIVPR